MRASYRAGVAWIANNDEPGDRSVESIGEYISTALVADLFGKTTEQVAKDVLTYRKREDKRINEQLDREERVECHNKVQREGRG